MYLPVVIVQFLHLATRGCCPFRKCIDHKQIGCVENWPPLVNFSTGSWVCLRAFHLVQPLIQPTSVQLAGCCAKKHQALESSNRWELPQTDASVTLTTFYLNWVNGFTASEYTLSGILINFPLGDWKVSKMFGGFFGMLRKKKEVSLHFVLILYFRW